ncbi:MAG TPA: methyltransferase domain-containing protein [Thermoanaerobaculia bacterium]|nr:methyltransferase domain-containing protein [Thermoanaerobaculia bacterium]
MDTEIFEAGTARGREARRFHGAASSREKVVRYYDEAGPDYSAWTRDGHMHFGWWAWGISPLDREAMLRRMTEETLARLAIDPSSSAHLLDLGCGVGASARFAAERHPTLRVTGLTLVESQVERGRAANRAAGLDGRVRLLGRDFTASGLASTAYDGAWALESACHDDGEAKAGFAAEAARLLRPGARLVVTDGFLKGDRPLGGLLRFCHDHLCRGWALPCFARLGPFTAALEAAGFTDVEVEDVSWRVAPSAAHIPWVTLRFLAGRFAAGDLRMTRRRWAHVTSCVVAPILGAARRRFGYCVVTARRSGR